MTERQFYEKMEGDRVRCLLCAHECRIPEGARGRCQVRINRGGVLESLVEHRLVAMAVDPVEKKPLYHFLPGTHTFSVATPGCNFSCRFCQNSDIAQYLPKTAGVDDLGLIAGSRTDADLLVTAALERGCRSMAFTYTEPTVFFEQAMRIGVRARAAGLLNIFVSNGYMSRYALDAATEFLDAANIDIKAFSDTFYRKYCSATLAPVLETAKRMKAKGIWVEITTLVIPGLNDDPGELRELASFIHDELGPGTPWHISRFHPSNRMFDRPPTPVETLFAARDQGKAAGLHHIYIGNVYTENDTHTRCHSCGEIVIRRRGFSSVFNSMTEAGRCPACNSEIPGIF